jgi:hypothetical protein
MEETVSSTFFDNRIKLTNVSLLLVRETSLSDFLVPPRSLTIAHRYMYRSYLASCVGVDL